MEWLRIKQFIVLIALLSLKYSTFESINFSGAKVRRFPQPGNTPAMVFSITYNGEEAYHKYGIFFNGRIFHALKLEKRKT